MVGGFYYWTVIDFVSHLVNYDDMFIFLFLMNRNINFDSHRWPSKSFNTTTIKIVFPINDALVLRLATTPKRDRLHEAYKGSTNINEFMVFRDHFGVSLSISFLLALHFLFCTSDKFTWLFINSSLQLLLSNRIHYA